PRSYGDDPAARERWARRYQIIPQLAPCEGEAVIQKLGASAFWRTPLLGHLTHLRIDTLLVGEGSTSGCVPPRVGDGCQNGLRVSVVEECVFARHQATHALNLFDMDQKYADVISLADAVAYLERWQGERRGTTAAAAQPVLAG